MTNSTALVESPTSLWETRVREWEKSGKTAYAWCRDIGVPYQPFLSWRRRLSNRPLQPVVTFVELPQAKSGGSGLEVDMAGAKIHLDKDFDDETLFRCLQVMRRL